MSLADHKSQPRAHRRGRLDAHAALRPEGLWKFDDETPLDLPRVEMFAHPSVFADARQGDKLAPSQAPRQIAVMSDTAARPCPTPATVTLRVADRADGVRVLTLDDPATRNALSLEMLVALSTAVADAAETKSVRVLVIAAEGPAFSSGHDLKLLTKHRSDADAGRAYFDETFAACSAFMQSLVALPKPVIAAVEGMAAAAGCQLVATCDLAIAGAAARFLTPGVSIGLFCTTPMVGLVRNVARKHAMEMLLTGEPIGAEDAHRIGLVNRVVPKGDALSEAVTLAERIAARSAMTLATGKRAFYDSVDRPMREAYDRASRVMVENMLADDAAEGIGAFVEKRLPVWRDR